MQDNHYLIAKRRIRLTLDAIFFSFWDNLLTMSERLTSFDQIQLPIEVAFFDLGGVVFSFDRGLESLAQTVNKPLTEVKAYWLSRDDDICRGILAPQQFYKDLVSQFDVEDHDMDFLQFWTSRFRSNTETHQAMRDV